MSEGINHREEQDALVQRYINDPRPEYKDMIIIQYSAMVERIARRFAGIEQAEDLVQVGYVGLLNALTKFDPTAGVRFNTYATHLVAGEIKHYLRDRSLTIRVPAWLQEVRHKVLKASNQLQASLGRVPTAEEIARELSMSVHAIEEAMQTQDLMRVGSLDATVTDDETGEAESIDCPGTAREQLSVEDRVVLEDAISQLRDIERDVLIHFHFDAMSQTEIANKLGISCNYVSHILRQSLGKLRRILTREEDRELVLQRSQEHVDDSVLDRVTGTYNEDYFNTRMVEEVHRASSSSGAMALLRIDFAGLEPLQRFYGQESVDDLLSDCGQFLKETVRRLDVVCRYGETGFAIILAGTSLSAELVSQRLGDRFQAWLSARRAPSGPIQLLLASATYEEGCNSVAQLIAATTPVLYVDSNEAAA